MNSNRAYPLRSALAALLAAALFGASTPLAKALLRDVPPVQLAGCCTWAVASAWP